MSQSGAQDENKLSIDTDNNYFFKGYFSGRVSGDAVVVTATQYEYDGTFIQNTTLLDTSLSTS